MDATELEQALADIEEKLEKLRVLYDQYFMGLERFEPVRKREDLERRIKVLRRENIRNTAQRFRFQQSIQRLNTFSQYWTRILREIEKGTYKRDLAKAARRFGDASLGKKKLTTADIERAAQNAAARSDEPEELDSSWLEADDEDLDEDTSPFRRAEIEAAIAAAAAPAAPKGPPAAVPKGLPGAAPVAPVAARAPGAPAAPAAVSPAAAAPAASGVAAPVPAAARRPVAKLDLDDEDDELFAGLDTSGSGAARPPVRPVAPVAARPASTPLASTPTARPASAPSVPASAPSSTPSVPAPRAPMPSVGGLPRPPMPSVGGIPRPPMPSVPGAGGVSAPRPPQPSAPVAPGSVPRPPQPSVPQVASSAVLPSAPGSASSPERGPRPEPRPAVARPEPRAGGRDDGLQDARIRDIYDRYVEARRRTNEPTGSLTLDGLSKSLRDSIPKLQQKHGGRVVDFEVVIKDGKTVLKPVVKST